MFHFSFLIIGFTLFLVGFLIGYFARIKIKNYIATIACLCVLAILCIFAIIGVYVRAIEVDQQNFEYTKGILVNLADQLQSNVDSNGSLIKLEVNHVDMWNRKIEVVYFKDSEKEQIKLLSLGPDGLYGTNDDIVEQRDIKR